MKRFHCSGKLKNLESEQFCQYIAMQFLSDPECAQARLKQALSQSDMVYWETLVMHERIHDLIKISQSAAEDRNESI